MSKAAKAYDLLYLRLVQREAVHDRRKPVRLDGFEDQIVGLIRQIEEAPDPVYLDR
jgi:ABC-type proline/glycine betaine transport system ATPase subunit